MTDHDPQDTGEVQTRPFADWIRELNRGRTHTEISMAMQDLVAAVQDTGKAGTMTLVLKVAHAGDQMVVITDDVKLKKPEARAASLFFLDGEMNLRRTDPNQDPLPGIVEAVRDTREARA